MYILYILYSTTVQSTVVEARLSLAGSTKKDEKITRRNKIHLIQQAEQYVLTKTQRQIWGSFVELPSEKSIFARALSIASIAPLCPSDEHDNKYIALD